jgi:Leucine-rich repeat (LRR) protein
LNLSKTKIETLPQSIGKLVALRDLNIVNSKRFSAIPSSIGGCAALQQAHLQGTRIQTLPTEISECTKLEALNLERCSCLRQLPAAMASMECLQSLAVGGTPIECAISSLYRTPCLSSFGMGLAQSHGCLPVYKIPPEVMLLWPIWQKS